MDNVFVEGGLDEWLIVSVPVTTSRRSQKEIKDVLQAKLNQGVLVISNNTFFMKATRLSPSETSKLIREGETRAASHTDNSGKEGLGGDGESGGDGGGPGVGRDGGGHLDEET